MGTRRTRQLRGAFTLLELLLVLAILAVLMGTALAAFGPSWAERELDHATERLVASLAFARERAIVSGTALRLAVGPEGRPAWIEEEADPLDEAGIYEPATGIWGRKSISSAILGDQVAVEKIAYDFELADAASAEEEDDHAYLYFDASGSSRDAVIVLAAGGAGESRSSTRVLRVRGLTGHVRVLEDEDQIEDAFELEASEKWERSRSGSSP